MTPYCFPHNAGRWRELEVGAGGLPHKRKSNHSRFICSWLLRLDDDMAWASEKKRKRCKREKEVRRKRRRWRRGRRCVVVPQGLKGAER